MRRVTPSLKQSLGYIEPKVTISTLILLVFGCMHTPCAQYVAAVEACQGELGTDEDITLPADYCTDFDANADAYFTCLGDAYDAGDCSSIEGVSTIDSAVAACTF